MGSGGSSECGVRNAELIVNSQESIVNWFDGRGPRAVREPPLQNIGLRQDGTGDGGVEQPIVNFQFINCQLGSVL